MFEPPQQLNSNPKEMSISKIFTWCICVLLIGQQAFSQTAKDSLSQLLAEEFCKSLETNPLPKDDYNAAVKTISLLIVPIVNKHKAAIKKEFGIQLISEEDFRLIGKTIGAEAALTCPAFLEWSMEQYSNGMLKSEETEKVEEPPAQNEVMMGTFLGLGNDGTFTYLKLKGSDGRESKIWWFGYFEGSENLKDGGVVWKGKQISVEYYEVEIYSTVLQDYVKSKIAIWAGAE